MSDFTEMLLEMFNERMTTARSRATDLEFQRKKYHNRSTEKYHSTLRKVTKGKNSKIYMLVCVSD